MWKFVINSWLISSPLSPTRHLKKFPQTLILCLNSWHRRRDIHMYIYVHTVRNLKTECLWPQVLPAGRHKNTESHLYTVGITLIAASEEKNLLGVKSDCYSQAHSWSTEGVTYTSCIYSIHQESWDILHLLHSFCSLWVMDCLKFPLILAWNCCCVMCH